MSRAVDCTRLRRLLASALVGAASGMRSTAGLAAVIVGGDAEKLPALLRHRLAPPAACVALAVELVLDKLPSTGSRLEPAGMAGRVLFAGVAGAVVGRERSAVAGAAVAIAAAALSAKVAHDVRARLAENVPDRAVAVVEDLAALGTAFVGCRA
ncbi:MAG: hypothetical protein ACLPUG_04985 [Acidimicrobiales bacterium]